MSDPTPELSPPDGPVGLMADPRTTVDRLLHTRDETRVRAIMRSLTPEQAADLVRAAPSSGDKARLLAAMERAQRAETLDHVAPMLFATLVENPETGTDYLLGEVSVDRFQELLTLCSPEQRFYWVSRAAAHNDGAAQLLTLLLPPRDLAEMLMTVPEFRKQFHALRTYEPGEFGEVPARDPELKAVLQFMADFDADMYKDVFLAARNIMDWEHVNREVTEEFVAPQPLRDFEKYEAPDPDLAPETALESTVEAGAAEAAAERIEESTLEHAPARADFNTLATTALTSERLQEIQEDLESMIQREIVDAGGSFSPEAMEQASGRVHCYLHYGLVRLGSGIPERMARLLTERPLISVMHAGMEYIEAIRQRALRIDHLRDWFDREQQQIMEGLIRPRVGTTPGNRTEYIFWLPTQGKKKEERPALLIDEARDTMEELVGWTHIARRMPEADVRRAMSSTLSGAQAYLAALAVGVTLYRRWDPLLIDLQDVNDFRDRIVDAETGDLTPTAKEALDSAVERWAKTQGMDEEESRRAGRALIAAGERLADWLMRYPRPKPAQCRNWVYLT